ncbi:ATP-binding protein [Kaistia terrae]|uniref:histidine kinase n=1 Tax=Kaistia terrae TaxID=537017 RepID=A0ABW0PV51_9HYPH|nr:ATP-binding protein [Kaistia terrae]MCX5579469.1 ATP-binding protein [Kaistia terrae]
MSGRNLAYLDLSALPTVGPALLSARPTFVWAADGRRVLWANAAGAAFFGVAELDRLLDRRFSDTLPSTTQIARFARALPKGATRVERISFATGGRLQMLAAHCTRIALADDTSAVLIALDAPRGQSASLVERAERLADAVVAEDCLVAILDASGEVVAASGGLDALTAAESAIEALVAGIDRSDERLLKRVIRIDDARRPAGVARFEQEGRRFHLLVVGPAERVAIEPAPVVTAPLPEVVAATQPAETVPLETPALVPSAEPETDEAAPEPVAVPLDELAVEPEPVAVVAPSDEEIPVVQPLAEVERVPKSMADIVEAVSDGVVANAVVAEEPVEAPVSEPSPPTAAETLAEPSVEAPSDAADHNEPEFQFEAPTGPIRFVFQMDAESRFSFVSPEFAAVVGPHSASIVGVAWSEVASARGLDAKGTIAALIARRDTWSGATLSWPVDGSDQRVSVDLAALPAFSRDRAFEGYRGFGVLRPTELRREPPVAAPKPVVVPPTRPPVVQPSNVVHLPRPAVTPGDAERLSMPEQDAFRRIAVALGAKVEDAAKEAETQATPVAQPPAVEPDAPLAQEPVVEAPVSEPVVAASEAVEPEAEIAPAGLAQGQPVSAPELAEPVVPAAAAPEPETLPSVAETPPAAPAPDRQLVEDLAAAGHKIAELEAILDTATDGVAVVDANGCIVRINRSAEALFGVDSVDVAGLPFTHLLAEESRKSALDYLEGLAQNGVASVLNDGREVIGRVPQGGLIPLFMTMGRLGETGKFCAVLRDITQWKNAEEELINARRAAETASMQKSDFLARVSHEIRTPLNAIIGFSEVMMEERFGPIGTERYKEYLRDINVSGAHLMSLLNDLLDLSKIEAGKLDLNFEAVALNEIVMECVAMMQPQANRERIIIRTSLSSQVPSIVADPRSIRQIVLNLVSNAVKFTLAGGQVIVSTALEERGEVTLRIRDTGIGMSEKDVETALMPFRQVASATKHRSDGTGLGLPLTKALVEANRAAFLIDSAVGQGTLIRVTFPSTRVLAG